MQLSATKILTFLINDMLDYAQLSAGQFRKQVREFDLIKSVDNVIKMMQLKSNGLNILIESDFRGLADS